MEWVQALLRRGRRRAVGSAVRATPRETGRGRWTAVRWDPRRGLRGLGRAVRPWCSRARCPGRRSAMRARSRRGGEARRSLLLAGGIARRRRAWWHRRRSSAPGAGRARRSGSTRCRVRCSARRRKRLGPANSEARGAASRRVRAAGSVCLMAPGVRRACRRRRRIRSRSRRSCRSCAQLLDPFGEDDPSRGLDEREVRERLREVPQKPAGVNVELLGVQTQG